MKNSADLMDVQLSMESAQRIGLNVEEQVSQIAVSNAANLAFENGEKETTMIIFKLVDTSRKGRVYIDGIDDDIINQ